MGLASASDVGQPQSFTWNQHWKFYLEKMEPSTAGSLDSALAQSDWEIVNLPHYGRLEAYDVQQSFQGFCWYQKTFVPASWMRGKRVTLQFEGAMQVADVWVDGQHRLTHQGGYLPFSLDLTDAAATGRSETIVVRLDNRDCPDVPPGRPQANLDFLYYSGIYRDVRLHVTDQLHISDSVDAGQVAGGGVFVRYENVSDKSADVLVSTDVKNDGNTIRDAVVQTIILDAGQHVVAKSQSEEAIVKNGESHAIAQQFTIANPKLWSLDNPYLYTLISEVVSEGKVVDSSTCHIGIRTLRSDPKLGFFLNGKHLTPEGTNRHQAYPYIGNALSDEAQYRDALKLKEAGFDIIRLCHYPQSPAFLDACDELGLLTIVCIPGWQHFTDTNLFKKNVVENLQQTIRRDRNHPSCVLWETSLNETDGHDDFFRHLVEVAHEEYPGDQMLTCGDTEGHNFDNIRYDVPYSGWDGSTHTRPSRAHGAMSLHREYGDNQFGGYSRYSRGDGEKLMLVQAWNFQTALNDQNQLPYTWGECTWEAIDNNRGVSKQIATCGVLDSNRLPKFMYYFYESQRDPRVSSPLCQIGPMAFIANYWTPKSPSTVVVYSNANEVELFVNGQSKGRQKPDSGPDIPFGDGSGFDLNYWKNGIAIPKDERKAVVESPVFNGGNCRALVHPPFTFKDISFEPGELKAVGYLDGKPITSFVRRSPDAAQKLALTVDYSGKKFMASGSDVLFVHAEIQDSQGTVVPTSDTKVDFQVEGPASIVSGTSQISEAGISTILLRSNSSPGEIKIHAEAKGLEDATTTIESLPPREPEFN